MPMIEKLAKNYPECLKSFSSFLLAPHTKKQNSNKFFEVAKNEGIDGLLKATIRKPEGIKIKMDEWHRLDKLPRLLFRSTQ